MKKDLSKIPYIIVTASLLGCFYFAALMISSGASWADKKLIYKNLMELVGRISANTGNIDELEKLKIEFDQFYGGEMIHGEADDKELLSRMMKLQKDFDNHLQGKTDYYRTDKLNQSCQKLIKQLSFTISEGDLKYPKKMFISMTIGVVLLTFYYLAKKRIESKEVSEASKVGHWADDEAKPDNDFDNAFSQGTKKVKILFLASNPIDTSTLRLDKEMREIEDQLARSKNREQFEFIKYSAVRISDLQNGLLNHSPNFVHFSGHGNIAGISLLDKHTDKAHLVETGPLAKLFELFSNHVICVFLNSCYSKTQGEAIKRFVPHVIGMGQAVPDKTAIEFATTFYKGIGAGKGIDFAFELAKNSVDLNNVPGSDIPVKL